MRAAALILIAAVLAGCGPLAGVLPPPREDAARLQTLERANRAAARRDAATLETLDGRIYAARALRLAPDSTTWQDSTGAVLRLPTAEVYTVTLAGTPRDPVGTGLLFAAAAGTVAYVVALSAYEEPPLAPTESAGLLGGVAAALGLGLGVATAVDGRRPTVFEITPRPGATSPGR